jgi:hypothetical protein
MKKVPNIFLMYATRSITIIAHTVGKNLATIYTVGILGKAGSNWLITGTAKHILTQLSNLRNVC